MAIKTIASDTFIRANQSGWGTASDGDTWATNIGTPTLSIASNEGHATNITSQVLLQLGSTTSHNAEVLVRVQTNNTSSTRMGVALRVSTNNGYIARLSSTANNLVIGKIVSGTETDLFTTAFTVSTATKYWIRFKAIGTNLYARAWADGGSEPSTWTLTGTDSSITSTAGFGLTVNASSTATTWDFDSFTVNDGTVYYDTTYRGNISQLTDKDTTYRGKISKLVDKDTVFRGNIGHTATHDTTYRGKISATGTKDTAYRGKIGRLGTHDTSYRGNLTPFAGAVFYASNVAQTAGGLTQSDQMSQTSGGTETSVSVTMPSSGINLYVELLSQGGTATGTSSLPSPTGNGWSVALSGNTILAGSWYSVFTLAKSGTAMSGASLYVRWYRRTVDGIYYPIGSSVLSSQTFSTKAIFTVPSVAATLWQFIAGDTLYMDGFAFNGSTAWASDVFTVYVSNSATQGVFNDAVIVAPQMISTPAELACYIGIPSLQTGTTLPIRDQSITIADAIDQRSIATLTGEDAAGTLSYQRAMPTYIGDHDQGLLYTGYVNSDKVSKPAAGTSNAQLEHALTMMDNHYLVDKRANQTNYLNWSAGDMVCDFIQSTLSQEGVTGAFALESDYTPATFGAGTLSGTVATTTTSPFSYAPNTATPPITSNTGDLELTRAGTQFTLTESVTSDFSSGTLTNMVASSNSLQPTTQKALEVQVQFPLSYGTNGNGSILNGSPPVFLAETVSSSAYAQIWSGSKTIASTDTLNYDIWISSTSPAFMAGVDFLCADGTLFSYQAQSASPIGGVSAGEVGYWDQNSVSADILTDLSSYAKDTWYTRSIPIAGSGLAGASGSDSVPLSLAGKAITSVSVCCTGSATGTYTVYVKNIYLGSASGSPFLSTSATTTNVNPPVVTCTGGYIASTMLTAIVPVFLPSVSSRVSPSHSISGVGLVQNSSIQWTASLPTLSAYNTLPTSALLPTSTSSSGGSQPAMVVQISYDAGVTWLTCVNQGALPGLPAGANVAGVSFLLKEYFSAGSDPSAIPALEQIQITINSAAAQTTTDVVATYGNATAWNTGTLNGLQVDGNGHLVPGGTYAPGWGSGSTSGQTFFLNAGSGITRSLSGGVYTMSFATGGSTFLQESDRFDFAGDIQNGIFQCDVRIPTAGGMEVGLIYRTTGWTGQSIYFMGYKVWITADTGATFGAHLEIDYGTNGNTGGNATNLGTVGSTGSPSFTFSANTWYTLKVIFVNNRHSVYVNGTLLLDLADSTYLGAGGIGIIGNNNRNGTQTVQFRNCTISALSGGEGTWQSANISLNALGTCGNTQIDWTELNNSADVQSTAIVLASLNGGTSWQQCVNGAAIPGLSPGTSVTGKNLLLQAVVSTSNPLTAPIFTSLYARVCGPYGTVTGTRISPALSLSNVGYVASSNCMWNANIPTNTSLTVQTTQDLSSFHTVGSNGAGEALPYWTNQPSATQDLFSSNTSANYSNTSKSGGSAASAVYDTTNTRLTLTGGSSGLYISTSAGSMTDMDMLVDMDESDAGGLVWREVSTSNYYELGVYDASSSGGFTNQLRLYKVASGTRSLLGSASSITFTRGTFHRVRVVMESGLINVYWDGTCVQSYLDTSPLGSGACGLRNDGGTSRYYQLWVQPLGTNLTGQSLYTKVTMSTTDPSVMPQLFTLVCAVRGPSIATGATISQLHPITTPFATYYSNEMDTLVQASGDYFWYVDRWMQLHFGPRLARPGAFPVQSVADSAGIYSGYLLYQPQVQVTSSADLFRSQQIITNLTGTVTPPVEVKTSDGSTTSWTMGYPLYSAPVVTINGNSATVGVQGIDNNRQFYWQPHSASISYDSSLPKLPSGTILTFTYVGESTVNIVLNNNTTQAAQATLEGNSGIVAEIESALRTATNGMTTAQATTFGNGLLSRYGNNATIEMIGSTRYIGLTPGTVIPLFLPEMMSTWNAQLPIVKLTTNVYQGASGLIWIYTVDATNGPNLNNYTRVWFGGGM